MVCRFVNHQLRRIDTTCIVFPVDCDLGQYNVPNTETCEPCGQGTYQDERAQEACKPCPDGGLTPGLGSADESACFGRCRPAG